MLLAGSCAVPANRRTGDRRACLTYLLGQERRLSPRAEQLSRKLGYKPFSLLWCSQTTVKDVAMQFPVPILLFPNDDVLALVKDLSPLALERVFGHLNS